MNELKPCPFCGGEARLLLNAKRKIYNKDEYKIGVVACCNVCEARMFYGSEKLAIEAWNRRTGEPTIEERKAGYWKKVPGYATPGGDPVWSCSECGKGIHVYGIEHSSYGKDIADGQWKACPNCMAEMLGEIWTK